MLDVTNQLPRNTKKVKWWARHRRLCIRTALALPIVVVTGCGGSASDDRAPDRAACPLGERVRDGGNFDGIVLACGELQDGRMIQLRYRSGCLEVIGMDDRTSRGCGYPPTVREPDQTRAIQRSGTVQTGRTAPIEVYGATLPAVNRVVLTYLRGGSPDTAEPELISVTRPQLLRQASIEESFGFYVGLVPANARRCAAVALDSQGEPLGVESCRPFEGLAPDAFILGSA